ncbi:hypothetical protein A3C37_01760 [Candidatus Peribacteria bacterium RIFCSPHIGHO2_02_FULL_53_20]|nr:MAG: hypothetical protein A3C37_01760 [Candidatus Peribacteria bacterium RIFCSPHIGHO2_02_FULL_53_20]OGJ65908.1 MAG: hypothetical protein A3B61_05235 [Candidatus Peribacteria bacterium RIFCSPLOWO2_01_FULL_53_10]OGJ69994.1 MAG: hypothetical protein A3G69_05170 [Candidatus Peribacteria bacterium RIFCSPLOWO2_12_FULL_53_10]
MQRTGFTRIHPLGLRRACLSGKQGFTLVEVMLTIAILSVITGVSIPMYRKYEERSCVQLAAENVAQGVSRARLLAQSAEGDSGWGYSAEHGVLFKGDSYATRDPDFDESYPVGDCAELTGLSEVAFYKLSGEPIVAGTIGVVNGEASANIDVDDDAGSVTIQDDEMTICHHPPGNPDNAHTITVSDSAWQTHQQNHGDTLGACPNDCDDDDEDDDNDDDDSSNCDNDNDDSDDDD